MDQSSPLPKNPDRGELSLVRRLFHALGKRQPAARHPISQYYSVPAEILEVRQVLSSQPFVVLALPEGLTLPPGSEALTAEDYVFVSNTVRQVSSTLQNMGWGHQDATLTGASDEGASPSENRGLTVPASCDDACPPDLADGPATGEEPAIQEDSESFGSPFEEVNDGFVPQDEGIDSSENADGSFSDVISPDFVVDDIAIPDVATLPEDVGPLVDGSTQNGNETPPPPALPSVFQGGPPRDLRLQFRFDWNGTKHGLEIEQPDDSTLLITIRGPEGAMIPEARRRVLQDSISKATAALVQNIAPGSSVQISLFATAAAAPGMPWEESGVVAESSLDDTSTTLQSADSTVETKRTVSAGSLDETLNAPSYGSPSQLGANSLDIVFENVGGLLFSNAFSEGVNPWSPPLPAMSGDKDPAEFIVDRTGALIPAAGVLSATISTPEPSQLTQVTLGESSLTLLNLTTIGLAPPQESDRSRVPADLRQATKSTSILKLLFAESETSEIGSSVVSSGTPQTNSGSQSTTAAPGSAQGKRQRQPQRESSAAVSLWRDSDNEQPPIPTSDGSPREVQFADRSRGPPLLRSARDDLLTDYEAPAGLLERLRYSISPRGPSLVTVDVQLPETLVLFGAES